MDSAQNISNDLLDDLIPVFEDLESKLEVLRRQFDDIGETLIRKIAEIDPTPQKTYITWLLRRYREEPENVLVDEQAANAKTLQKALALFDRKKTRRGFVGNKDIASYATVTAFLNVVDANNTDGMEVINQRGPYTLHMVTTLDAVIKLSLGLGHSFSNRQTEWCTRGNDHATRYLGEAPLYAIRKGDKSYVLMHFPSPAIPRSQVQVKDPSDHEINEAFGNEIAPICNIPEIHAGLAQYGFTYTPSTPDTPERYVINPDKLENTLESFRKMFFEERWKGFSPNCPTCAAKGYKVTENGLREECPDCNGEGKITYGPYTNPQCKTCKGATKIRGEYCPECVAALEKRWQKRKPIMVNMLNRCLEDNNQRLISLVTDYIPAKPGYHPTGAQALFNALFKLKHG